MMQGPDGKVSLGFQMKNKPGYKTTEFWMTALMVIGSWAGALQSSLPPKFAAITSAIAVSAYAIARGIKKSGKDEEITVIEEVKHGRKKK